MKNLSSRTWIFWKWNASCIVLVAKGPSDLTSCSSTSSMRKSFTTLKQSDSFWQPQTLLSSSGLLFRLVWPTQSWWIPSKTRDKLWKSTRAVRFVRMRFGGCRRRPKKFSKLFRFKWWKSDNSMLWTEHHKQDHSIFRVFLRGRSIKYQVRGVTGWFLKLSM